MRSGYPLFAMMRVLYEDNHLLVVVKPVNVPMQEDSSGDYDLLNMAKAYIKEKYQKPGAVYLGLVHRLDRPVGGVCVFARTSKAASRLSDAVRRHDFHKTYLAVVENPQLAQTDIWRDKLWKDVKHNRVSVDARGKDASLSYRVLRSNKDYALVEVDLHTGRSHQIRVQFASRNHPLYGDQRYNPHAKVGQQIALWSYRLSFLHPTTKQKMEFTVDNNDYPFQW